MSIIVYQTTAVQRAPLGEECEAQAKVPELETPAPRYTKKQIAEALTDFKGFNDARKAGRRRLY